MVIYTKFEYYDHLGVLEALRNDCDFITHIEPNYDAAFNHAYSPFLMIWVDLEKVYNDEAELLVAKLSYDDNEIGNNIITRLVLKAMSPKYGKYTQPTHGVNYFHKVR